MSRYFRLFLAFMHISTKALLEHRLNAIGTIVFSIMSIVLAVFFVQIIFEQTNSIAGWSKYEMIFLIGACQMMTAIFTGVFIKSINRLPSYIQQGELDGLLTKPVNTQFFVSFRMIRANEFLNILPGIVVLLYGYSKLDYTIGPIQWLFLLVGLVAGTIIIYGIYYMFATLSFWLIRFAALNDIYLIMKEPLSYPLDIFGGLTTFVLTFLLPLIFVLTVPVKIFLDKSPSYLLAIAILVAALCLIASDRFWHYAVKRYTSASS